MAIVRLLKQFIYGGSFLLVIIIVGVSIYYARIPEPTCTDGIENGQEEGVDCGLLACGYSCLPEIKDLEVLSSSIFRVGDDLYDVVAQIKNPNNLIGAVEADYDIILKDGSGEEVGKYSSEFYILPGQTRYVIETALKSAGKAVSVELKVTEAKWDALESLGKVSFPLRSYETLINNNQSELRGIIINQSDFDFDRVEIRIILFEGDKIVGVNKTNVGNLGAGADRHFIATWPNIFNFSRLKAPYVESDTNLFLNSNYIKSYGGSTERFQKYY